MQVSGLGAASSTKKSSSAKKAGSGGAFAAHLGEVGETQEASSAASVSGVSSIGALLAIQEVDGYETPRKKAVSRGKNMVEYLDDIRVSLLTGEISHSVLKNLDSLVKQWREGTDDEDLEALIDEIELRAAVELAKLENA